MNAFGLAPSDLQNKVAAAGKYTVRLDTSATVHGAIVRGAVWANTVVDTHAPTVSSLSAATSIYPYHDGYRDTFAPKFRMSERAALSLVIRDAHKHVVRTISATRNAGTVTLSWNGRDTHNHTAR